MMDLIHPRDDSEPATMRGYRLQYKYKEAAYMLNTSENTLLKWLKEYDIPSYKINEKGDNFVLHKDLEVLITRGAVYNGYVFEEFYGAIKSNWDIKDDKSNTFNKKEP